MTNPFDAFMQQVGRDAQKAINDAWPVHRDNLRKVGIQVPDSILIPGVQPSAGDSGRASGDPEIPRGERFLASAQRGTRGKRYTWGGDTFSTWDCSALVVYAGRDLGIAFPRTTYQQINSGKEIPWGQQQIGDLVFSRFSAPGTPEHVSIWAGNGKVYEAGDPIDFYAWGNRGTVRVRRVV